MGIESEVADLRARNARKQREAFDEFMRREEAKLFVSMVPPTQPPELVVTLLRSAFNAGHDAGLVELMDDLVGAMLRSKKDGAL